LSESNPRRISLRLWASLAVVFLAFLGWYDYSGGPLAPEEVAEYERRMREHGMRGTRVPDALQAFVADDDGDEFFNVVLETYRPDAEPFTSVSTGLQLLRRACHPVASLSGHGVNFLGADGEATWGHVILVRYRSRRDFLEIFSQPEVNDEMFPKLERLEATHAWPTRPEFALVGVRAWVLLALLTLGLAGQALLWRRRAG
jgi:hypothetical protein